MLQQPESTRARTVLPSPDRVDLPTPELRASAAWRNADAADGMHRVPKVKTPSWLQFGVLLRVRRDRPCDWSLERSHTQHTGAAYLRLHPAFWNTYSMSRPPSRESVQCEPHGIAAPCRKSTDIHDRRARGPHPAPSTSSGAGSTPHGGAVSSMVRGATSRATASDVFHGRERTSLCCRSNNDLAGRRWPVPGCHYHRYCIPRRPGASESCASPPTCELSERVRRPTDRQRQHVPRSRRMRFEADGAMGTLKRIIHRVRCLHPTCAI